MDTYEKKYNEALERARKIHDEIVNNEVIGFPGQITDIFPELRESEDERIRKWILEKVQGYADSGIPCSDEIQMANKALSWLEKQKEQKPAEQVEINKSLSDAVITELGKYHGENYWKSPWAIDSTGLQYPLYFANLGATWQKEQKPNSTEDMPYITDEHFYEREPKDSFKYKLAEYMTRCCTKKEGPYGYEYGISAESILKMAEEELLKRGVVQKPAEWRGEDEAAFGDLMWCIEQARKSAKDENDMGNIWFAENWLKNRLKSLRPSWKPSEEQIKALESCFCEFGEGCPDEDGLRSLYNDLKKLMSL